MQCITKVVWHTWLMFSHNNEVILKIPFLCPRDFSSAQADEHKVLHTEEDAGQCDVSLHAKHGTMGVAPGEEGGMPRCPQARFPSQQSSPQSRQASRGPPERFVSRFGRSKASPCQERKLTKSEINSSELHRGVATVPGIPRLLHEAESVKAHLWFHFQIELRQSIIGVVERPTPPSNTIAMPLMNHLCMSVGAHTFFSIFITNSLVGTALL